ncbi:MAG TPA: methyltransferase domain-containing protein [Candidatus Binatia bacterium]|jgi:ubiquinone/menaquinone biosynthesis C-methylase UbiE|nr:methyltransferase domain-containing protein [Candidatus Binatia bacterium]
MIQTARISETFKARDAASYDSVTAEFERFTDLLSTPLAARMLALAELAPAQRVLDVGTGTGVVALQTAAKIGVNGKILGIDLSDGMLAAARVKAARAGFAERVEFRQMDAEALAIEDRSFDRVLSLFALLHFPNPPVALREMFRVLRPGGKLVVAVGSGPPWISLRGLAHRARRLSELLLEFQGKRLFAPAFLNSLVEHHIPANGEPEETALARASHNRTCSVPLLVRSAGFTNVRTFWQGHQALVKTPEEFWDVQRTFSSIGRKRLSNATPEKVEAIRQEFLSTCRKVQSRGGSLVYPLAAFYVVAHHPFSVRETMKQDTMSEDEKGSRRDRTHPSVVSNTP